MKTRFLPVSAWLVAIGVGVVLFIGAFASFDPASSAHPTAVALASPPSLTHDDPPEASALPPLPAHLSPGLSEVIKLAQAHVDEGVVLAYIKSSGLAFSPTADEILYLSDLGLSQDVIGALVKTAPPAATPQPQIAASVPTPLPAPEQIMAPPIAQAEPPPANVQPESEASAGMFLNNLAPYGTWSQQPDYGLVWQPTAPTMNDDWAPYVDAGQWVNSDIGWYWQSDYTWGWATFHYGRWVNLPRLGWVWQPGNVWAPAWVTWRSSSSYVGWAPLPPGAGLNVLGQLTYYSKPVGANSTFGLPPSAYKFVTTSNLTSRKLPGRIVPAPRIKALLQLSVSIDNYAIVNNRIINGGVSPEAVAAARGHPLPQVALRGVSSPEAAGLAMDRKTLSVYVPPASSSGATSAGQSVAEQPRARVAEKLPEREPAMYAENDATEAVAVPVASKEAEVSVQLPPLRYTTPPNSPAQVHRYHGGVLVAGGQDLTQSERDWPRGYGSTTVEHPATSAPRLNGFNPPERQNEPPHFPVESHPAPMESRPAPVEPPHAAPPAPAPAPASSSSSGGKSSK